MFVRKFPHSLHASQEAARFPLGAAHLHPARQQAPEGLVVKQPCAAREQGFNK